MPPFKSNIGKHTQPLWATLWIPYAYETHRHAYTTKRRIYNITYDFQKHFFTVGIAGAWNKCLHHLLAVETLHPSKLPGS